MNHLIKFLVQQLLLHGHVVISLSIVIYISPVFGLENNSDAEKSIPNVQRQSSEYDRLLKNLSPRQDCSVEVMKDQGLYKLSEKTGNKAALEKLSAEQQKQCLISADKAYSLWKSKKIQFVDVRSERAYSLAHIPASINIPEYALKTKAFLRETFIVLVNQGYSAESQIRACLKLKDAGFKHVAVLQGGILGWIKNEPLQGNNDIKQINQLSPLEFLQAVQENDWTIVDMSREKNDLSRLFPGKTILKGKQNLLSYLKQPKNTHAGLLVVGANKKIASDISESLQNNSNISTFYLKTSIDDYREFLAKNRIMQARLASEPKRVKRCGG